MVFTPKCAEYRLRRVFDNHILCEYSESKVSVYLLKLYLLAANSPKKGLGSMAQAVALKQASDKHLVLDCIQTKLVGLDVVLSARLYGSWIHDERSVDVDVAVVVPSFQGMVDSDTYTVLRETRRELCRATECDVDLVPHTEDEFSDKRSPLWNPRYNPSLVFGETIKGAFPINPICGDDQLFGFMDLAAYVIHDNRTICRRQLARSLSEAEGRIFVSKLLHGPGNALTFFACQNGRPYLSSPSDLGECFARFGRYPIY